MLADECSIADIAALSAKVEALAKQCNALKASESKHVKENAELQAEVGAIKKQSWVLFSQLKAKDERIVSLQTREEQLRKELTSHEAERLALCAELERIQAEQLEMQELRMRIENAEAMAMQYHEKYRAAKHKAEQLLTMYRAAELKAEQYNDMYKTAELSLRLRQVTGMFSRLLFLCKFLCLSLTHA